MACTRFAADTFSVRTCTFSKTFVAGSDSRPAISCLTMRLRLSRSAAIESRETVPTASTDRVDGADGGVDGAGDDARQETRHSTEQPRTRTANELHSIGIGTVWDGRNDTSCFAKERAINKGRPQQLRHSGPGVQQRRSQCCGDKTAHARSSHGRLTSNWSASISRARGTCPTGPSSRG